MTQRPDPISRQDFDALDPTGRRAHLAAGGTIFNGEPKPPEPLIIGRETWDRLPRAGRQQFLARGGKVEEDVT